MERNRPHCPRLLFRFPWEVSPRAVLELARTPEIPRVTALVRPENHPSRRLLEKAGFLLTGESEGKLRYCFRL